MEIKHHLRCQSPFISSDFFSVIIGPSYWYIVPSCHPRYPRHFPLASPDWVLCCDHPSHSSLSFTPMPLSFSTKKVSLSLQLRFLRFSFSAVVFHFWIIQQTQLCIWTWRMQIPFTLYPTDLLRFFALQCLRKMSRKNTIERWNVFCLQHHSLHSSNENFHQTTRLPVDANRNWRRCDSHICRTNVFRLCPEHCELLIAKTAKISPVCRAHSWLCVCFLFLFTEWGHQLSRDHVSLIQFHSAVIWHMVSTDKHIASNNQGLCE